jgi:hypothetical protein
MEPSTATSRTAPAFKILSLFALGVALGCHGGSKDPASHAESDTTAMPAAMKAPATARGASTSASAADEGAADCLEHGRACGASEHAAVGAAAPVPAASGAGAVGKYGAPLGTAPAETLASVLAEPTRYAGHPVRVEGHVRRACTAMGCWMELAESSADDAPGCRVIMKDHAFFVPTDSAGSNARVEGTLAVRRIDPEQVTHMEHEGAAFPHKAADGSAEELRFVASGVELWRGS